MARLLCQAVLALTSHAMPRGLPHCRNVQPFIHVHGAFQHNPGFESFPQASPAPYVNLALRCIDKDPRARPTFSDICSQFKVSRWGSMPAMGTHTGQTLMGDMQPLGMPRSLGSLSHF